MADIFALTKPPWEIVVRATVVYFALVLLVRVIPKRRAGSISPNDMVALIVIGGLATDAIMGGSDSVTDIVLMIGLIVAWSYVTDALEFYFPPLGRFLRDRQTTLVRDGRLLRRNMQRELITEDELMAILREERVSDLSMVEAACMEADGQISVVRKSR
ncbi:DUF421 domain-containing protein [Microvirga massiliensis]|uniref:DUF421 domain-containing protein n=1 Tax=Microvirga massiliensis TaxID=1033741 RepID=UPI00062BEF23|nr:YetF domain-containing protein [Microvirga massiliensis]